LLVYTNVSMLNYYPAKFKYLIRFIKW